MNGTELKATVENGIYTVFIPAFEGNASLHVITKYDESTWDSGIALHSSSSESVLYKNQPRYFEQYMVGELFNDNNAELKNIATDHSDILKVNPSEYGRLSVTAIAAGKADLNLTAMVNGEEKEITIHVNAKDPGTSIDSINQLLSVDYSHETLPSDSYYAAQVLAQVFNESTDLDFPGGKADLNELTQFVMELRIVI